MKPKILIYDLEVSPTLAWTYGHWKTNVLKVEQNPSIMSISWCWYDDELEEQEVLHANMAMIPRKRGTTGPEALVKLIHGLFDEADFVVAHNAYKFDNKIATTAFIKYNLTPPSPYKTVDTLRVARSVGRFGSNSLDSLCTLFGIGTKSDVKHSDIWYRCLAGDQEAWELLRVYNNQDVVMLYKLYEKLRPYVKNHPNLGDIGQIDGVCPKCGSAHLEKRGFNMRRNGKVQRYQCKNCGGWTNEAKLNTRGRLVNG